jgi:hypothetical protein
MADIFISYKSSDRPRAETLSSWLQALGLSVWLDREIDLSEGWEARIDKELHEARLVVDFGVQMPCTPSGYNVKPTSRSTARSSCKFMRRDCQFLNRSTNFKPCECNLGLANQFTQNDSNYCRRSRHGSVWLCQKSCVSSPKRPLQNSTPTLLKQCNLLSSTALGNLKCGGKCLFAPPIWRRTGERFATLSACC